MQACATYWKDIPDDTISIYSWALFLLLRVECKFSGINFEKTRKLIECVTSIDSQCPANIDPNTHNQQSTGQFFNQISAIEPLKSGFHAYFPALSPVETQLINFPIVFMEFLNQFDSFIPEKLIETIGNRTWFDGFFKIVDDESDKGNIISMNELLTFVDWHYGRDLILKWNQTLYELNGDNPDLQYKHSGNTVYEFRKLVEKADHIKSTARQFGASNPFSMLHEFFNTIFSKLGTPQNSTNPCALAYVYLEPNSVNEGDEFELTAVIQNTDVEPLQNVHLSLEFLPTSSKNAHIQYRLGPVFYSGISAHDETINFLPASKLMVKWRAAPVLETRLTEEMEQSPLVNMFYEKNGEKLAQKLNAPNFKIMPKKTLRIFAMGYPTVLVDGQRESGRPFTLLVSFMNTGYTPLKNMQILELSPWIVQVNDSTKNLDYKISSISKNSQNMPNTPYFSIEQISSGEVVNVAMNLATLKELGMFRNVSMSVKIGEELPSHVDFRFFFIHQALNPQTLIISEATTPFQLYYYETWSSKIVALQYVDNIEQKQEDREANTKPYRSVLVAYRRIPVEGKEYRGPVMGSLILMALPENMLLIRASELLPGVGAQQRVLSLNDIWMVRTGNESTSINFIDLQASNTSPQLIYEFIFGNPNDFTSPYFSQNFYRIQLRKDAWPEENTILGTISAVSPIGSSLNYSLVTEENNIPYFQIDPKNGKIVLTQPLPQNATEFCFNIITTDSQDQKTAVPVAINTGGRRGRCSVYAPGVLVNQYLYWGNTTGMKEMAQSWPNNMNLWTTTQSGVTDPMPTPPMTILPEVEVSLEPKIPQTSSSSSDNFPTPGTIFPLGLPSDTTTSFPITLPEEIFIETTTFAPFSPAATLETFQTTQIIEATISTEKEETTTRIFVPIDQGALPTQGNLEISTFETPRAEISTSSTQNPSDFPSPETNSWISIPDRTLTPFISEETGLQASTFEISTIPTRSPFIQLETINTRIDGGLENTIRPTQVMVTTETPIRETISTTITTTTQGVGIISYTEGGNTRNGIDINVVTIRTSTFMPIAPLLTLPPELPETTSSSPPPVQLIPESMLPGGQRGGESDYAAIIQNACLQRNSKPIWGVICDMAKTVHFKAM